MRTCVLKGTILKPTTCGLWSDGTIMGQGESSATLMREGDGFLTMETERPIIGFLVVVNR